MALKMLQGRDVELFDGELKRRERENRDYMLRLETRALMLNFEMEAGLAGSAETLPWMHGGWENPCCQLRGHFPGHWLSAAAMRFHASGDRAVKAQADDMIDILEKCQLENGDGWAGPIPEKYLFRIAEGKPVWAPQYTLHKVFMGLVDMYQYAGNEKALAIAERWAEWFLNWTASFTREQMDDILDVETGGMLEIWADLYGITGREMYRTLMARYYRGRLFDALLAGEDPLTNMHANTTIPEVCGCARAYEVTGEEKWRRICEAYWKCAVTDRGTYVTGGQTLGEIWTPKHEFRARLGDKAQEHCTVYNMMRLADYLFRWTGDKRYGDYIERNLYNGIMAQAYWEKEAVNDGIRDNSPRSGLLTYFLPMRAGSRKGWASEKDHFYCCHGTLVQANAAHNRYMYYQDGRVIYACQFFDSACRAEIDGQTVTLTQRRDPQAGSFHLSSDSAGKQSIDPVPARVRHNPETKRLFFTVHTAQPVRMTLKVRVPDWTEAEAPADGYMTFDREWRDGDSVCVELPMRIRAEYLPDDDHMAAFTYGPMTLAGQADAETMLDLHGRPAEESIVRESEREWAAWTELFKTVGQDRGIRLLPLYRVGYEPYEIYFPVKNKPGDRPEDENRKA